MICVTRARLTCPRRANSAWSVTTPSRRRPSKRIASAMSFDTHGMPSEVACVLTCDGQFLAGLQSGRQLTTRATFPLTPARQFRNWLDSVFSDRNGLELSKYRSLNRTFCLWCGGFLTETWEISRFRAFRKFSLLTTRRVGPDAVRGERRHAAYAARRRMLHGAATRPEICPAVQRRGAVVPSEP